MLSGEVAAGDGRSGAEGTGMCGEGEVELTNQAENEEAGQVHTGRGGTRTADWRNELE